MEIETYDKNRVINFSDAVFSIAMTLLVLEVAVPEYSELQSNSFGEVLSNRTQDFIGLLVSFLVSALYWAAHLRVFKYVSTVDGKLLWINIFLLLSIVLLPFSTALYVNGVHFVAPFVFYCMNLAVIGFLHHLLLRYVYRKEKGLTGFKKIYYIWYRNRGFNVIIIWILGALLAVVLPYFSKLIFILLFINQFFIDRYYKKKILAEKEST